MFSAMPQAHRTARTMITKTGGPFVPHLFKMVFYFILLNQIMNETAVFMATTTLFHPSPPPPSLERRDGGFSQQRQLLHLCFKWRREIQPTTDLSLTRNTKRISWQQQQKKWCGDLSRHLRTMPTGGYGMKRVCVPGAPEIYYLYSTHWLQHETNRTITRKGDSYSLPRIFCNKEGRSLLVELYASFLTQWGGIYPPRCVTLSSCRHNEEGTPSSPCAYSLFQCNEEVYTLLIVNSFFAHSTPYYFY